MNYKEFKKLVIAKSFVDLYQHYFRIFLITKGYFSKNLSYKTLQEICRRFSEIIHIPYDILESLHTCGVGLDTISIIDRRVLEVMNRISKDEMINAFSELIIKVD